MQKHLALRHMEPIETNVPCAFSKSVKLTGFERTHDQLNYSDLNEPTASGDVCRCEDHTCALHCVLTAELRRMGGDMRVHQSETVAIVGAGPYGLSLAAHLDALGIPYHIFGQPMRPWRDNMPPGMLLKSDGESSSLSDPDHGFPIERFYKDMGQPFHAQAPIPVETFIAYGQAFQRRFVPTVDTREVVAIAHDDPGFVVRTADGDLIRAGKVVLAVGIAPFSYIPPALSELPPDLVTHASAYGPVSDFRGRAVAVVGSGASAIDLVIALHGHGADVQIVSRRREIPFQTEPSGEAPGLLSRVLWPGSGIGSGWKLKFCAELPGCFQTLPERTRIRVAQTYLGPAPGWFTRERVLGHIPVQYGVTPEEAVPRNDRVELRLRTEDGSTRRMLADHVIAATGYRIDVRRFGFLSSSLMNAIRTSALAPSLSRGFETSVPGLYVIGPAALMSFGPVMRFVFGADFAARRVSARLGIPQARSRSKAQGRRVRRRIGDVQPTDAGGLIRGL
ncbi:MAG TPA: NAD(P)-binding domain-containing protein [Rhodopila sp.]|nr:NAD(P)-binding domain-containing protein [Rhodopila sp.]